MKDVIAMRPMPGATAKEMLHHAKGCIVDCTQSIDVLHRGKNDVSTTSSATEIVDSVTDLDGNKLVLVLNATHHFCMSFQRPVVNSTLDRTFLGMRYKNQL